MKTSPWKVLENRIIANGKSFRLPYPASKSIELPELLVILLDPPKGTNCNTNVMGIKPDGTIAWQIEESPHGGELDQPYVDINQDELGNLVARNWNGVEYEVDLRSGAIHVVDFRRF
jgi:hypothetical protein